MFDYSITAKTKYPPGVLYSPENLLFELQTNFLEVVLIPADEPKHACHKIRAVQSSNAEWYKDFCSRYRSNRRGSKWRTRIRRRATIVALEKLIKACDKETTLSAINGLYVERLIKFICEKNKTETGSETNFDLGF